MKDSTSRMIAVLGTVIVFGVIIGYLTEFEYIDSTLGLAGLVLKSIAIAVVAGFITAYFTIKSPPNSIERTRNFLFVILAFLLVIPLIAIKSNRWFAEKSNHIEEFTFVSQKPVLSKPFGQLKFETLEPSFYLVALEQNSQNIQLKTDQKWISDAQKGSKVYLPVSTGFWRLKIVDVKGLRANAG